MTTKQLPLVVDFAAEEERLPLSIKIALGDQLVELIGAGSKVPVKRVVEVSNAEDNQKELKLKIMQGLSSRPEANALIGTYLIAGLAQAPRGTLSIELTLEVTPSLGFNLRACTGGVEYEIDLVTAGKPLGQKAIAVLMDEEGRDQPVEFDGTYDRAAFHEQAVKDEELPPHQAFVHTGMFLGWLVEHKLCNEDFLSAAGPELQEFRQRKRSAPMLYQSWEGRLHRDMLSETGNQFTQHYFDLREGHFLEDYEALFAPEGKTLLAVEDNWQNFQILSARINTRYKEWSASKG